MNAPLTITRLWAWTGLWVAVLLWAVNMLLGLNLPYDDCVRESHASAVISLAMLAATAAAAFASWRSAKREITGFSSPRTFRFIATMSTLAALVFAFALAMQMMAGWVLTGCER